MEELKKDLPWVKRMENGTIGESRTKSFLLDRFWVLERSVDIEGADFLIQRKLFRDELYNKNPVVLGIVQVKFYESENTAQYIPVEYFLDDDEPRKDFFAILNTGKEDNWEMYLLTADDLKNDFDQTIHNEKKCVYLPGKKSLISKYKINSKTQCLNRIENSLRLADFKTNRNYLLYNHFVSEKNNINEAIDPIYKEYIPNDIEDIQEDFIQIKKSAQSSIYKLEEIIELYNDLLDTTDPEKAIEIIEDLDYETYNSGNFFRTNRQLTWNDNISKDYLEDAVKFHKKVYELLKTDGNLDFSLKNKEILYREVSNTLKSKIWNNNESINLQIQLNPDNNFEIKSVICNIWDENKYTNILDKQTDKRIDFILEWKNNNFLNCYFHPTKITFYSNKKNTNINDDGNSVREDLYIYDRILINIIKTKYKNELKDYC